MAKKQGFFGRLFGGFRTGRENRRRNKSGKSRNTLRTTRAPLIEALESRVLLSAVAWTGAAGDNQLGDAANYSTGALPTSTDDVVVPAGASALQASGAYVVNSLECQGDGVTFEGTNSSIGLTSGIVKVDSGTTVMATTLTGPSGLTKQGAGTLVLSGANTFEVGATVEQGALIVTSPTAIPDGSSLTVGAGGEFIFDPTTFSTPPFDRTIPRASAPDYTPDVSSAVVAATGAATLSANDLGIGTTRFYSSALGNSSGGLGNGWVLADAPYAVSSGSQIVIVFGPTDSYRFTSNGSLFTPEDGAKETLTGENANHLLEMTRPDGSVYIFNDFSYGTSDARSGQFLASYAADGSVTSVAATDPTASGQIAQINFYTSAAAAAADTPYQVEDFSYYTAAQDPANAGRLQSIILQGWNGSSLVDTRLATYSYYGDAGNCLYGDAGDLESATTQVWDPTLNGGSGGWSLSGQSSYYRYCTSGRGIGLLALTLTPQNVANTGGLSAAEGMTTAELVPCSAEEFQYGSLRSVTQVTISGLYTDQFSNTPNTAAVFSSGDPNVWSNETVETCYGTLATTGTPESVDTVFTNALGQTLLTDLADPSTGQHWVTDTVYGTQSYDQGLVVETANPAAVDMSFVSSQGQYGYDSSANDLDVHLKSSGGQLTAYTYAAATTAGETTPGDAAGYLKSETLYDGTSDTTGVIVDSYQYYSHAGYVAIAGGGLTPVNTFPTASTSTYPNAPNDLTPDTTGYSYTWWDVPGTERPSVQVEQETTTLPVVSAAENGSGVANTESQYFDANGNLQWEEDGNGSWTYDSYDPITGLLSYSIEDISAAAATALGLAPPASLPAAGIAARTDYAYDPLGRQTQELGPAFVDDAGDTVRTAAWTSYLDYPLTVGTGQGEGGQGTEVRTASGFEVDAAAPGSDYYTGEFVLVDPIGIEISNLSGQVTDDIQAADGGLTVVESSSAAVLAELSTAALPSSSFSRWTHHVYDLHSGQLKADDVYINVGSKTFLLTQYTHDDMGRLTGTFDPTGTTTTDVFDARGLLTSVLMEAGTGQGKTDPNHRVLPLRRRRQHDQFHGLRRLAERSQLHDGRCAHHDLRLRLAGSSALDDGRRPYGRSESSGFHPQDLHLQHL